MFDITKEDLRDLLRKVDEGKIQLPDFQRDYVWNDSDVRSLLASVAKGFPVGALLTLDMGGEVNFHPRLIEGVAATGNAPEKLLLDGQQRITSLYQATYSKNPVRTRTHHETEVLRFYYLDMRCAVQNTGDLEEAIIGVPSDRVVRRDFGRETVMDLSSAEKEYEQHFFPLNQVFDSRNWFYAWRDFWKEEGQDTGTLEQDFVRGVLERIERYKMPIICLDKSNTREAICLVFEKVNVGGKKLDAFELVTAIYAADRFDLRKDWNGSTTTNPPSPGRRGRMAGLYGREGVLAEISSTDFLQACSLLHTRQVRADRAAEGVRESELPQITCKREAVLALPLTAYQQYADSVEKGFIEAERFANELKIIGNKDLPYPPLMVGLASVFAVLGRDAETVTAKEKLARWFWCVTLGELYSSSTESRLARDVPQLIEWIRGTGTPPISVEEALFQKDRLKSLKTRSAAAYKGIHALLMKHGCRDFISGRPVDIMTFHNDNVDIHHVFPKAWCKQHNIPPALYNSILNKTPLSKSSNISVGGHAPSVYLGRIEQKQGLSPEAMDAILRTHLVDPALLRTGDFNAFIEARASAIAGLVAEAMGKPVIEGGGANEAEREVPATDEDDYQEAV